MRDNLQNQSNERLATETGRLGRSVDGSNARVYAITDLMKSVHPAHFMKERSGKKIVT